MLLDEMIFLLWSNFTGVSLSVWFQRLGVWEHREKDQRRKACHNLLTSGQAGSYVIASPGSRTRGFWIGVPAWDGEHVFGPEPCSGSQKEYMETEIKGNKLLARNVCWDQNKSSDEEEGNNVKKSFGSMVMDDTVDVIENTRPIEPSLNI